MDDGKMLLKAVMRSNAKDVGAAGAFIDYLQEHIPGPGGRVEVRFKFRVRYGAVWLERGSGAVGNPAWLMKVVVVHGGRRVNYGSRMHTIHVGVGDPRFVSDLTKALKVFRS